MHKSLLLLGALAAVACPAAHAGTRTSVKYTISADTADFGGVRTTSNAYTNDGGVEVVAGISSMMSPADVSRNGYVGQLTEVTSLSASSASSSIAQGTSTQLAATATLDDGTTSALLGTDLAKNPMTYPFSAINTLGQLFAAANVYAAPVGTVTISYLGASASVSVQVLGPYANGGIPDAWFVQYFGVPSNPNPNAAPGADADGTGQTNLFKYLAGLNPLDGSRFVLTISPVAGQSGQKTLTLTPVYSGRTYAVQYTGSLTTPNWTTLSGAIVSVNATTGTMTDPNATPAPRFYRVQISMP